MNEIKADPEKIKQFSEELRQFLSYVEEVNCFINGQLHLLHDKWKDSVYDRFKEEFDKNMKLLLEFSETAYEERQYLDKKVKELEEFLKK